MADRYAHVREPIQIGGVTLRNRIARTAHNTNLLGLDGKMTDAYIAYHEARARGGVALSFIEGQPPHKTSVRSGRGWLKLWVDDVIPGLEKFTTRMHEHGMAMFVQLDHMGVGVPPGSKAPTWSSSEVPDPMTGRVPKAMTKAMIDEIVEAFVACTRNSERGGIDGVEIHGGHGYLPHQFLSPVQNRRTDEYGGSFENRMRFLEELLAACKAAVSPGFPIGVRLSGRDMAPGGLEPEDVARVAQRLEQKGLVDYVNVSMGSYYAIHWALGAMFAPRGYMLPTSRPVTAAVSLPTFVTGRILSVAEADEIIAEGTADVVSMVRANIADPEIVNKAFSGRADTTRPCIGCNQGCIGQTSATLPIGCTVNPVAGRELQLDAEVPEAESSRDVLVVGGGPAGMEAARTAALAGHRVVLHEATERLGGQARFASKARLREDIGLILEWLEQELERLDVDVRLSSRLGADEIAAATPDVVLLATGSQRRADIVQRLRPDIRIDGVDRDHVHSSVEFLGAEPAQAHRALVFDDNGEAEAASIAETLLERGIPVTFATSQVTVAPALALTMQTAPYQERLGADERFELRPRRAVAEIGEIEVTLVDLDRDREERVPADLVVLVGRPGVDRSLEAELERAGVELRLIGDAVEPSDLLKAIRTGHDAARALDGTAANPS